MPTYLCHGFRWERQALRGWVALHDIDDGAPDWIIAPGSAEAMLRSIAENHPYVPFGPEWRADDDDDVAEEEEEDGEGSMDLTAADGAADKAASPRSDQLAPAAAAAAAAEGGQHASRPLLDAPIRLLEEYHYDENAMDVATPPFAYVADHVVRVETGVNVAEEMRKYESLPKKGEEGWFERLMVDIRVFGEDTLGLGWYVVVCDDEVRDVGFDEDEDEEGGQTGDRPAAEGTILEQRTEEELELETNEAEQKRGELRQSRGLKSRLRKMVPLRKKAQD